MNGSQSTGTLSANKTYTLTCSGAGASAAQSATVSVTAPLPTVSLGANPTTVASGATAKLTWSSTNATSCTASGGWSGTQPVSGSLSTPSLTATTKFTLACTGSGGTATQSATVTVTAASGTATLTWQAPTGNTNGSTPVTPLTGYHIYYGTSAAALNQSIVVGASTTSYEITGLSSGTWYFAVAAMAADGTESPQSNVGSKTI
jgi:Fibronectin type III domain